MADTPDALRGGLESGASKASEGVQKAASAAMGKAQEFTSAAAQKASDLAAAAGKRVDDATSALGERAKSAAHAIRDRGPQQGMLGSATGRVADSLESAGSYLQEEGLAGMAGDVAALIRRNPIGSMFVGIGIGYMLARILRR